jgi:hypothetical protein
MKNMLMELFSLLFQSKKAVAPDPQCATTQNRPISGKNGHIVSSGRLATPPANGNYPRFSAPHRNGGNRACSSLRDFHDLRGTGEAQNAEQLRVALVGFNVCGFTISSFTRSTDARLTERVVNLPAQIRRMPHRNIAIGLRDALQMLTHAPQGRTAIVIITSGPPTTHLAWARELLQTAVKWRTGIHVIQVGHADTDRQVLADLTTQSALVLLC